MDCAVCGFKRQSFGSISKVRYLPVLVAVGVSAILSYQIKSLDLNMFFTLCLSAMIFGCSYLLVLNLFREKLILEIETQFFSKIGNILKRKPIEKK